VQRAAERTLVGKFLTRLRVKMPSPEAITAGLSGGNQQKIALAKWLARDCDVLLIDEPTRGVDVGAKAEIYHLLDELACEGKALLVVSSELPELIGLCRRILVLREGRLAGELPRAQFSEAALLQLMAGVPAAA
jgi:ABC-type sugar transport system ATPase subunit